MPANESVLLHENILFTTSSRNFDIPVLCRANLRV
jgi:hypothetical protein